MSSKQLKLMRGYVSEALTEGLPARIAGAPRAALGSSGTIGAVVAYAATEEGSAHATGRQISQAVEDLVEMSPAQRRKRFDARRAEIVCAGAVILEQLVKHLGLESVTAVQRGLREGILVDLIRRKEAGEDHSLHEAALVVGRRFHFDEAHAVQVTRLGLQLFDDLAPLHNLPASARPLLEVAGLLHDVGNAVSYQKHHRHSYYLIVNAEIPGLRERERELVARIARYHRRSPPDASHSGMEGLGAGEVRLVRKLATLLRVADSLDRSHRQSIVRIQARLLPSAVLVRLKARSPLDLELWDATREAALFRRVFGRKLLLQVLRHPRELQRKSMRAAAYLVIDPRFR
jgi:exopolyphosphatase/guanosine-5'-triphosphate,3'-diphosphate pyrophosphatase